MKKLITILAIGALAVTAQAATFTFAPKDLSNDAENGPKILSDLNDLDHYKAYTWGIGSDTTNNTTQLSELLAAIGAGQTITSAKVTIYDIWDWTRETTDSLKIHLLDNTLKGETIFSDNQNPTDYFDGQSSHFDSQGPLLKNWSDPDDATTAGHTFDLVCDFSVENLAVLKTYLTNATGTVKDLNNNTVTAAVFGLGFDPDCHYYNNGVKLEITTGVRNVPEGGLTLSLLGLGLVALVGVRRRIRN